MNSARVLAGIHGATTSANGVLASIATGTRSLSGSYPAFLESSGPVTSVVTLPISKVWPSGSAGAAAPGPLARLPPAALRGPAGRERHDQPDRLRRVGLRAGRLQCEGREPQRQDRGPHS